MNSYHLGGKKAASAADGTHEVQLFTIPLTACIEFVFFINCF
jgi:hypothetical protein